MSGIIVSGFRAVSGQRYGRVENQGGVGAILPIERFSLANSKLADDLAAAGFLPSSKADLEEIVAKAASLADFHEGVAEHVGWNGDDFVHRDGAVLADTGVLRHLLFDPERHATDISGTHASWRKLVAKPAQDYPTLAFIMMAMFAGPILRLMPRVPSLTFEIVGDLGTGRSSILTLAASVAGSPAYVKTLGEVLDRTSEVIRYHHDYPLLIDCADASLMAATKNQRASAFQTVTLRIPNEIGGRVTVVAGPRPMREVCSITTPGDLIISLPISDARPGGNLEHSAAEIMDGLLASASSHHGSAFPLFVGKLHSSLRDKPGHVLAVIEEDQAEFLTAAKSAGSIGDPRHLARAFAAVYAAGKLATRRGVLPKSFPCLNIALAAYQLCLGAAGSKADFKDRLEQLIASGRLVKIEARADQAAQVEAARNALGTLLVGSKERTVRIEPAKILEAFPDWPIINKCLDVRGCLKIDGKNLKSKGRLAPSIEQTRLYQFRLPLLQEPSMFDSRPAQSEPRDYPEEDA